MNESRIKELENKIEKLKKEIKDLKYGASYPQVGDKIWTIYGNGSINKTEWTDSKNDRKVFLQGRTYTSKEGAEFGRERERVLAELERLSEPENREWYRSGNPHYYMIYDYEEDAIKVTCSYRGKTNDIYFATNEECVNAIDKVGEERLEKYYFRIKR